MKNKKKLISLYSMIVGTLLVVAGLFSFGVYAALNFNATTNGILNYTDKVCYIKGETDSDNVYYPSLNSALASVTDGGTICVFKTVSMSADITITKNVTIQGVYQDSNINMGANSIIVNQGKTLNLGGGDKILTVVGSKYSADSGVIVNKGTLNLNLKSKIENNQTNEPDENCAIGVYNSGSLSVSGSIINTVHGYAILDIGNLGVNISNSSTNITGLAAIGMVGSTQKLNISGGSIEGSIYGIFSTSESENVTPKVDMVISGNPVINSNSGCGICVSNSEGKLEIKGSPKISASGSKDNMVFGMVAAVMVDSSTSTSMTLNISGGTFNAEKLDSNPNENVFSVYEIFSGQSTTESFNISGGTFNAPVGLSVISTNVPVTTPNTISGGTFNKGIVVNALGMNITGGKFIAGPNNAAIDGEYSNIAINTGSTVGSVNLADSSKLTLKGSPLIEKIISTKLGTTEDSAMIFIEDSYAPTTKAKIEFLLNGSCNYIAKYTGSKNASASIFDSQIISASGKYLKTRGFTTTVVDNGGSLKGNIKTYYPSMSEQSFAIGSNTKTGSTLTGYTVAWADTTHSTTLPTATTSRMSIPANAYGNVSLTPTWSSHTYTIKYNGNGATGGSTANSTHTYGVAKALTANGYTKTGYTFAGWATSANGAVVYQDKQSVTSLTAENGATITLYAKWTANKYKVRYYDTYANTTTYTEVEYTYDNNTLKFPNGSLDNFTFVGWVNSATNLSPDGAYKYNTAVSNLSATNNAIINVYSLYSRNVIVSYNGNGATSGSTASETKTQYYNRPGSKSTSPEFTVAANGFTKTGYAFTNWTNGSTTYAPGAKITPFTDQNVVSPFTLTAQWSQNHSTIKLGTMTNVTKVEYKEGESGTYKELTTAGFSAKSNTKYYFKATLATVSGYTITFTNFTSSGWFTTDTSNPSSAHSFTTGGQTYTINASASKVQNTATIKRGDITNVTKVYYSTDKTNWVELTTTGFTAKSNTSYYFKADLATATGYTVTFKTFGGWFTDTANPSAAHSFTEKGTYTVTATADKKINTYSITYNLDGGTVATANPTSYTVETATFTLHNPTKTGYTFTGWTGSNGTTAQTSVSIVKGSTGNKTYTANWSINKFTVNIVSNNTAYGTVDVAKVDNVPYGSKVTVSGNTITVNGTKVTATATANTAQYTYAFSSWSIANNATITGATTITATFTQTVNKYTVTIAVNNANYGSVSQTSVANVPYGTKLSASSNVLTVLSDKKVTATAKTLAGYNTVFSSWTNGTATVQGNLTVTANFTRTAISYTISYDLKGGSVATANPTTYTIETATFTLHNPTRQGYTFAGWTGTGLSSASTSVSIAKGSTGNRTYTATWTPNTNTAYKVEHYQEGLDGKYVLKDTDNLTGTTDTTANATAKSYTGFTYSPSVSGTVASGTIAANGSLVLKLYYTRNSYTLALNKGTGIATVTGAGTYKFGASVSIDATVSSGYSWSKWTQTTGGAQVSTTKAYTFTMPANNVSYTATTTVNGYTVTYDAKTNGGSTANQTKTVAYGASVDLTLTATKDGWTFVGWNTNKSATTKLSSYTMPANNVTLYAIYSKVLTGAFKYYNNKTQNVTVTIYNTATSGSITAPAALGTPSGYTFRHWSTSNTANAASTVAASKSITISANATYYASYQKSVTGTFYYCAGQKGNYSSTFDQLSATATATQYMNYTGTKVESNFTVPTAVTNSIGGEQAEQYKGLATTVNSASVIGTPTTANTTFYAVYSEGLTFKYWDGSKHTSTSMERRMLSNGTKYNSSLSGSVPTPAAYDGASFISWQCEVSTEDSPQREPLATGVNKLFARYRKSVEATFNYHNGTAAATAKASANRLYVSNDSYGINTTNNQITVPTAVTANRTISSVTYTYRGVSTSNSADATVLQANAITTANTTYYASYSYTVTLTFNGNGATSGTAPSKVSGTAYMQYNGTKKGVSLTLPANPFARTGYTLDSTNPWNSNSAGNGTAYKAKTAYSFTASATIYAKWNVNTYTVTIKSNNTAYGNVDKTSIANVPYNSAVTVSSNKITINGTTVTATPATKTAQYTYTFTKWSVANGAKITGATTITATFSQTVNKYTVTFDANGGTTANPSTITKDYNAEIGTLPTTTKANYVFNGWYTAKTGGTKISTTTKVTANVTYYAQWTSAQAKIGSTYFATLADAVTYANNNSTSSHTIELLVNALTISSTLNINANITIKEVSGITNATIKRNVTTATFNMFNVSAGKSLTISGNSKTDLITLDGQGGAGIYSLIANNGTLSVNYVKFYNNNAVSTSNTAKPNVRGGAIHGLAGSTTSISNCTFNSNKANYGGALLFDETATISGISSSEFTSNTAYKYGGAVYLAGGKDIKFTSCKFTSNTLGGASGQMGDAFYIQLTNVTFDSCEFTSNTNKSHTIHVESTSIDKDNKYIVKFNNTTVTGSQLVYVSNNLSYKQDHVLTISGGSFANIQVATTAKTYTPVYISASATISKITFGQDGTLSSEASTKAIVFASSTLYNSMSSTLISGATVPSGYKLIGDGSTAINCCKVYTITINANGGSGGSASPSSYTIKTTAQTVTLTPPSSTNYGFVNWTIETNSSGATSTISGNTLTIKAGAYGNIKVKANWSKIVVKNETTGKLYLENMGSGLLQKAINEASDGNVINYYVDITEDITINKSISLYSGFGCTLTSTITLKVNGIGFPVNFGKDGTVSPTKIVGTVKNTVSGYIYFRNVNITSDCDPCIKNLDTGEITIYSGTYKQIDEVSNVIENLKTGGVTINGGTLLVGDNLTSATDGSAVVVNAGGRTTINAGTLHAFYGIYIGKYTDENGSSYQEISNVTISGGTITGCSGSGTAAVYMNGGWPDTLTISGGTLNNDDSAEYDIYRNNGSITISKDVDFDIFFGQLQTDRIASDALKIDPSVTITKNHKIGFNSNGSNGIYYLYSSTSEATRNSMFNHVTLVDRYNLSKPNAAHSKYTKDTTYYGMLYLGNVVNETKFKVYSTLSSAIDDATRSTDDHGGDLINIVSSFTESAPIELSYCYTLFTSTGATFTGSLSLYRCSMQFGSDDGYPFYMNGNIQIDGDNSDQWMGMYTFDNAHITNSVNGGACITISASFANINLTDCELNATGDYTSSAILITKSVDTSGSPDIYINNSTITSTHGYAIKNETSSANYIKINSGTVSGTIDHVTISTEGGTIKGAIYLDKNHTLTINGGTIDALIYVEEIGNSSPITFNKDINFTRGIHLLANETSESKPLIKFNTSISKTFGILIFEDIPGGIIYAFSSTNKTYYDSVSNVVLYMDNTGETLSVTEITKTSTSGSTTTYTKVLYIGDVINITKNIGYTGTTKATFNSAISAASSGDTIMLVSNIGLGNLESSGTINITKSLTLVSLDSSKGQFTGFLSIDNTGTVNFGNSSYSFYMIGQVKTAYASTLNFVDCKITDFVGGSGAIVVNSAGTVNIKSNAIISSPQSTAIKLGTTSYKATLNVDGGQIGTTSNTRIGIYVINAVVNVNSGTIGGEYVAITNFNSYDAKYNNWTFSGAVAASSTITLAGGTIGTTSALYSILLNTAKLSLKTSYAIVPGTIGYYTSSSSYKLYIDETVTGMAIAKTRTFKIQLIGIVNNVSTSITGAYSSQGMAPIYASDVASSDSFITYKVQVSFNSTGWKYLYMAGDETNCRNLITRLGGSNLTGIIDNSTSNYMVTRQGYYHENSVHSGQLYVDTAVAKVTNGTKKFTSLQSAFNSGYSDITIISANAGDASFTGDEVDETQETITVRTASGITYNGKITVKQYGIVCLTNFTASISSSNNYYLVDSAGKLVVGSGTTISSSVSHTIIVNDIINAPDDQFINGNGELEVNSGATISNSYQTGVVIANKGYTTINGGTISSTSAGSYATGVMNYNNLKMNGGTIRVRNGATRRGVVNDYGVDNFKSTFTMTNGIIDMPSPNSTTYGIYNSASYGSTITIGASSNTSKPVITPSFNDNLGYSIYNNGLQSSSSSYPITLTGYMYAMIIYLSTLNETYAPINISGLKGVEANGDAYDVIRLTGVADTPGIGYYTGNASDNSYIWVQMTSEDDASILRTTTECTVTGVRSFDEEKEACRISFGTGCFDSESWVYVWDEKKKKIRRKRAKNITYKDKLLVWNFDKGCFDFANAMFIQKDAKIDKYTEITFSDGTKLNVVNDHAVFNVDLGRFCPVVSNFEKYGCPVGSRVLKNDGTIVTVVKKREITKEISYTNIITKKHLNCYVNGILTSTAFNNMYPIKDMKFVKDGRHCENKSLLAGINEEIIKDFRLEEIPDKVLMTSPLHVPGCKTMKDYIDNKLDNMKPRD